LNKMGNSDAITQRLAMSKNQRRLTRPRFFEVPQGIYRQQKSNL